MTPKSPEYARAWTQLRGRFDVLVPSRSRGEMTLSGPEVARLAAEFAEMRLTLAVSLQVLEESEMAQSQFGAQLKAELSRMLAQVKHLMPDG